MAKRDLHHTTIDIGSRASAYVESFLRQRHVADGDAPAQVYAGFGRNEAVMRHAGTQDRHQGMRGRRQEQECSAAKDRAAPGHCVGVPLGTTLKRASWRCAGA